MAADLTGTPEDGVATADEVRDSTIAALVREREGYRRRLVGSSSEDEKAMLKARLASVDAAVKDAKKGPARERAVREKPEAEQATSAE